VASERDSPNCRDIRLRVRIRRRRAPQARSSSKRPTDLAGSYPWIGVIPTYLCYKPPRQGVPCLTGLSDVFEGPSVVGSEDHRPEARFVMTTTFAPVLVESLGRLKLVHAFGELDISNSMELSDAIDRAAASSSDPILVSFVECAYIDTSSLTVLVNAHRKYGKRLHVIVPFSSPVRRIVEVTGLHRALTVHEDFRSAIEDASSQLTPLTPSVTASGSAYSSDPSGSQPGP
jgi:anti-anti-sigma factor